MKFLDYFKEPVIRKHIFGHVQITIGNLIFCYFMLKTDTIFMSLLFFFMWLSFILGYRNILGAEKIFEVHGLLGYLRKKSKPKELRGQEDQEYINNYEKRDIFQNIFSNDMKEQ